MSKQELRYLVVDTSVAYAAGHGASRPPKGDMHLLEYVMKQRNLRLIMAEEGEWPADLSGETKVIMLGTFEEWQAKVEAFRDKRNPTYADILFLELWTRIEEQDKVVFEPFSLLSKQAQRQVRKQINECKREIISYIQSKPKQSQRKEKELRLIGEDFHLIKGVLLAEALGEPRKRLQDCREIIFSRDGEVRRLFADVAEIVAMLQPIVWVHMNTDDPIAGCTKGGTAAARWLAQGAPFDVALTLGGAAI